MHVKLSCLDFVTSVHNKYAIAGSAQHTVILAENLQLVACAMRFMEFGSASSSAAGSSCP